jgi:hypothetical protein
MSAATLADAARGGLFIGLPSSDLRPAFCSVGLACIFPQPRLREIIKVGFSIADSLSVFRKNRTPASMPPGLKSGGRNIEIFSSFFCSKIHETLL